MLFWEKTEVRAIRGAITAADNTAPAIESATCEMLREIERRNAISPADVVSAFFSLTPDLDATFPARAARTIGWEGVPMLDTVEVNVPGSLARTIRVLIHVNTDQSVRHTYLGEAKALRPDLGDM
jgi:chorismate mutase